MPLADELKDNYLNLLNTLSADASESLSQLLGKSVIISLQDFAESKVVDSKLDCAEASVLVSQSISSPVPGLSLTIADLKTAWTVADFMTGGEGNAPEELALDEEKQGAFLEAVNQSLSSAINKITSLNPGLAMEGTPCELRLLDPANEESLAAPDAADNVANKFSITINDSFNAEIHFELSSDIAAVLAEQVSANVESPVDDIPPPSADTSNGEDARVSGVNFAEISDRQDPSLKDTNNLNLLMNISMGMVVELGRSEMPLKDILKLTKGSVIELDRLSGEPVDLFVNNKLIARGEVVVIDDNFGLRITQLAGKLNLAEEMGLIANE